MYYLLTFDLNVNDETYPITPTEQVSFDIYHQDDAFEAFAQQCRAGAYWRLDNSLPIPDGAVIGYSITVPDIYNEQHHIILLIHAFSEEKADDAAIMWILEYLNDVHKAQWLEERAKQQKAD